MFNGDARLCWKTLFHARTLTTTHNTTDYIEPISNTNANYQELNPNSIYQELNPNTNYQELKLTYVEINQYQSTPLWSYAIYYLHISVYRDWNVTFSWVKTWHVTARYISIFVWCESIFGNTAKSSPTHLVISGYLIQKPRSVSS